MNELATVTPREHRNVTPARRIGGRLKRALDLMVWGDGTRRYLPDNEAAVIAGMNVIAIRSALQRPHVLAYYKQQRQVLLQRESAANIHRLCEIRDADNNMPAVNAIKTMEGIDVENAARSSSAPSPGVTIRIVNVVQSQTPANEIKTIEAE